MRILLNDISDRAKWLSARKIGSSDAAAIAGVHPYRTRFGVWARLVGLEQEEINNEFIYFGNLLEPVIAAEFSRREGLELIKNNQMIAHPDHDFITCTVDFYALDGHEGSLRVPVEIKNVGARSAFRWADGEKPDEAHLQLMHQLACCGANYGYIVALIGGNKLVSYRVDRDEELINKLIALEVDFWKLVETKTAPALTHKDKDFIDDKYPIALAGKEKELISFEIAIARHEELKAELDEKEKELEQIKNQIKNELGDCEIGRAGRFEIVWKNQSSKRIDSTKLKAEMPEIYEKFLTESSFRKFTIKTKKETKNG